MSSCSSQPCIGHSACSSCQIQTKFTAASCSMQSNIAGQDGGGLYMYGDSQLWSQGNTFSNNFANGQGKLQQSGCAGSIARALGASEQHSKICLPCWRWCLEPGECMPAGICWRRLP